MDILHISIAFLFFIEFTVSFVISMIKRYGVVMGSTSILGVAGGWYSVYLVAGMLHSL